MAPSSQHIKLLTDIAASQAKLVERMDTMNVRLFGGEGQRGALPILFDKHEEVVKAVTVVKDKITTDLKEFDEKEVKPLEEKVTELQQDVKVTMWRTGAITGIGGSFLGAGIAVMIKKLFGV
jgi:hypothetical protein